jgi:Protein of unknown function (DUF1176)
LGVASIPAAARGGTLPGTKSRADRAAWRAILHWPASCEQTWIQVGYGSGVNVWPVADGRRLVEVSCYLGAYQGTEMLYLTTASRHAVGPLRLLTVLDAGAKEPKTAPEAQILGIISFAAKPGRLSVFAKFRGLGDCGTYSTYRLAGDGFRTIAIRAKPNCDGKPPYNPARWPKLSLP